MRKLLLVAVLILGAVVAIEREPLLRQIFAQSSDSPVTAGTTAETVVINGMPVPTLGRPVGGVLAYAAQDGAKSEIRSGPNGTFIVRLVPINQGARGSVELSLQPMNFIFTHREMPVPFFLPPGHSLKLNAAGDRVFWNGYDVR